MSAKAQLQALGVTEVAEDVYKLGTRWVNYYLVAEGGEFTLIDAGYPGYWNQLSEALAALSSSPDAVRGVLVTHHHVDHAGTTERLRTDARASVFVGAGDTSRVSGEEASYPLAGFYRQACRPSMLRYLAHTVAVGGARYRPVQATEAPTDGGTLDFPGSPTIVFTPGHTSGHYSVALRARGVLFTGDAMVNFDYATGRSGIALHRFNEDRIAAATALDRLADMNADLVLFGHGEPWTGGVTAALDVVRSRAAEPPTS